MDAFNEAANTEINVTFEDLVGEGKRFKDAQALAKGKAAADNHIKTLETELAELRSQVGSSKSVKELLEEFMSNPQSRQSTETPQREEAMTEPNTVNVEELVERKVQQIAAANKFNQNFDTVNNTLVERFGTDANAKVKEVADDLGFTVEEMKNLAGTKPKAFLKYFDMPAQETQNFGVPTSRVNSSASGSATVRNKAFYDNLKKGDPRYFEKNPEQYKAMHRDALALGEDFFR